MLTTRYIIILLLTLSFYPITAAFGADFKKGMSAARKGDFATALREWTPLAAQGDAQAQFNLGNLYHNGDGVPKDTVKAMELYEQAAKQGLAKAQYNLAFILFNEPGVPRRDKLAFKWFKLSAEQGFVLAQTNLGVAYALGRGVRKNQVLAYMWLHVAAQQGDRRAADNRDLLEGRMSQADIDKAQGLADECAKAGFKGCGATAT